MRILLYKGKSLISKLVRFQTRSSYSHAAVWLDDNSVIEAWHRGGVRRIRYPLEGHDDDTVIDVFRVECDYNPVPILDFLQAQVGKKYDFRSVARFISRRKSPADDKWFCSELVLTAFSLGGVDLLHANPSETSPRDISLSPYLHLEKTIGG